MAFLRFGEIGSEDPFVQTLLSMGNWVDLSFSYAEWFPTMTGDGYQIGTLHSLTLATTATAASSVNTRSISPNQSWSIGRLTGVINWSKQVAVYMVVARLYGTANGVTRFSFGKAAGDGLGLLANKGIGWSAANLVLSGVAHDGSSLDTNALGVTLPNDATVYGMLITSDGAGNVEWFVDVDGAGLVSKAVSTDGPTGDSAWGDTLLQFEIDNGGDALDINLFVANLKVLVEQ